MNADCASSQAGQEINKVAGFADDPPSTLERVVHPVRGRDINRHLPGNACSAVQIDFQKSLSFWPRGETPVKAYG
jgi:hypothetical protein